MSTSMAVICKIVGYPPEYPSQAILPERVSVERVQDYGNLVRISHGDFCIVVRIMDLKEAIGKVAL